jgi:hypothetical protein
MVDLPALVVPYIAAGRLNLDGIHWPWDCHRDVGQALAAAIGDLAERTVGNHAQDGSSARPAPSAAGRDGRTG